VLAHKPGDPLSPHMNEQTMSISSPTDAEAGSRRILEAVAYLDQCRAGARRLAILTSGSAGEIRRVLQQFLAGTAASDRIARVLAPTDSRHAFLDALLLQLGFEPFESSAEDLQRLLGVVLRQAASQKQVTIVLIEDAQQFGPRVLELLQELVRDCRDLHPPPLFILTGNAALHRILDSAGMASLAELTRTRFDLPAGRATASAVAGGESGRLAGLHPDTRPCLVLDPGSAGMQRFAIEGERLLIGRGEHADITIIDRFVSRQHALFLRNASGDWILDLKSTNGTSVNSVLVRQRRLAHGDIINIGNHRLLYHNPAARTAGPLPAPGSEQLGDTAVMRSLQAAATGARQAR